MATIFQRGSVSHDAGTSSSTEVGGGSQRPPHHRSRASPARHSLSGGMMPTPRSAAAAAQGSSQEGSSSQGSPKLGAGANNGGGSPALLRRLTSSSERLSKSPVRLSLRSEDSVSIGSGSQQFAPVQFCVGAPIGGSSHAADELDGGAAAVGAPAGAGAELGLRPSSLYSGQRSKSEGRLFQPLQISHNVSKQSKRENLKVEKKKYRKEKKRAAKELLSTLKDPSVIVMADWLKVRGSLKSWTRLWCVLKPGLIVLYKSHKAKSSHWVGTVLLNTCELLERPSKKDGFCFKLFHPLDQSIWATKGPKGENFGAITQPLPYSYLIFRAPSEAAGKCWMDALELALRCSNLLIRTMTTTPGKASSSMLGDANGAGTGAESQDSTFLSPLRQEMNESDCERHFAEFGLEEDARTDREEDPSKMEDSASESDHSEEEEEKEVFDDDLQPIETPYIENLVEELGQQGDACQTEEVADENKSIIWSLVKQVRPGMDLSKVVLPTFILEPRSLLDKFTDYYYHADLLSEAVKDEDAYTRMKNVVRWYLSGFYKKPKGLKKPYNPILGETFRCYWRHPQTGTRTFYVAEQISHHPPVSAFYITNRQDGFSISGSVLAKSKFYGNSLSAIMDGGGRLTFLKRGEDYLITMPYAHCKGILIGTLTMEMGGKVNIDCEKTGYRAELEFKLKPFLGTGEASNKIAGKIKLGGETLATIDGKWDQEIFIKDKPSGDTTLFWNPTPEVKEKRLRRYTVPLTAQTDFESEKLWSRVTEALKLADQEAATREKFLLEETQRQEARERKAKLEEWVPKLFDRNEITGDWEYKYKDLRPWDPMNDVVQFEHDYIIQTKTRHRTPIVRTVSITNVDESQRGVSRSNSRLDQVRMNRIKRASIKRLQNMGARGGGSGSSTPDMDSLQGRGAGHDSESTDSGGDTRVDGGSPHKTTHISLSTLRKALHPLEDLQRQHAEKLSAIQGQMMVLSRNTEYAANLQANSFHRDLYLVAVVLVLQMVIMWIMK